MSSAEITVRPILESDLHSWLPLWDGYNAFYGREVPTALDPTITKVTWSRFFDPIEPVFALVAEFQGQVVGFAHFLHHRSTIRLELTCYLQDLYTSVETRGRGVGRTLIEAVYATAKREGIKRVYWQTHQSNSAARLLYDKVAKHHGFIVYSHDT
jgi:GNAT superfamily N-acetyltransferase